MPPITVIGYKMFNEDVCLQRVPTDELRYFQNSLGIHVCPSEVEGYGHYIMEAMSAKAVVITTNAAPMNEFIKDNRCLVPYFKKFPCALGIRYFVEPEKLREVVQNISLLSEEELREIGEKNRDLKKTEEFYVNLKNLLVQTALKLEGE
jgi:glycosyltransferase involved in cell wall biosynthesis